MRVIGFTNSSAAAYWRIAEPFKFLRANGIDAEVIHTGITDAVVKDADVIVLQSCVDREGIALIHAYQKEQGKKLVMDEDDDMQASENNPHKIEHERHNVVEIKKITAGIADLITTTQRHLADKLKAFNSHVAILPNSMDMERWDLPKLTNDSPFIRIGWFGSVTHKADIEMIAPALRRIMDEFSMVRFFFMGDMRFAELFEGYPVECMTAVPFDAWPSRLHGLRLDIGLAPLEDTEFNRCKSNIKFMEYAIAQIPGIYSSTVYNGRGGFDGNFGLICYKPDDWYQALRSMILNESVREDIRNRAYAHVKNKYDLGKNWKLWKDAYQSLFDVSKTP